MNSNYFFFLQWVNVTNIDLMLILWCLFYLCVNIINFTVHTVRMYFTARPTVHTRAGSTTNLTALVLFVYAFKFGQLCKHINSKQPLTIKIKSLFFPSIKAHNMHLKVKEVCFIVGMWINYCLFTFSNSVNSVNIQTLNSPPPSK